jgi:prepilin-type processing-associated H-X9-DG protein
VALSERNLGDGSNGVATEESDTFLPGTHPVDADEAIQDCNAVDINDLSTQRLSTVGMPWIRAYHSTTMYFQNNVPNGRSCMYPPGLIMTTASSRHTGGVNVVMCDGSARFVSNDVNLLTWRALASRNGEEVIGEEF